MDAQGDVRPLFSTPDAYFDAMQAMGLEWPVVHDDLQHHSAAATPVLSRIKPENREAEHLLPQADTLGRFRGAAIYRRPAAPHGRLPRPGTRPL